MSAERTSEPRDPRESPCYGTALRKATRRVAQLYDGALAECGLKSTQFAILAELNARDDEPPSLAELANALVVDRSALGHNLRPLERDGYVVIAEAKSDRRIRKIALTSRGKAKYREARVLWQAAQRRFAAVVGDTDAVRLRSALLAIAYEERLAKLSD
jgi:DNA-binding MarR family transcriptional regulator